VSRPKAQGTQWESELVRRIQDAGLVAGRHAEGGSSDVADVWIGSPVPEVGDITVVAWKRLTGDGTRRTPDGERDVVVMRTDDFLRMYDRGLGSPVVHVECKATQALNVTRVLFRARGKVAKAIRRRETA
jgi:hypothetical protein